MAAEHQTNVLRRIDQFLPNGLRPVSGRKFVALAFFATAIRIEKRMGQDDYPVVAVFFRLDQTARPVERLVAGREFESDHQQIAPRRIMEFIGGILQRMNIFVIEAGSGQMVWFSSSAFLDDKYNALSSGANVNLGMNALSSLVGESEAMAIRSKSLNYNYLTISASTSSLLKVLMIGIVPLAYLGVGIAVVVKRRRMQNEAV